LKIETKEIRDHVR